MWNVGSKQRANLPVVQRQECDGATIISDELHVEPRAITMHKDRRGDIALLEAMLRQVTSKGNCIEFFNGIHNFGRG